MVWLHSEAVFLFLCLWIMILTPSVLAGRGSRRKSSLDGRRGDMDDSVDVIGVRPVPVDNRTPGQRAVALASLEILVAGEKTTTERPRPDVEEVTRRPVRPCLNGGIHLLGSFCYCPPKYMGRYCEIYRFNSSCGRVPHGGWVYMNCNSCHCVAGVLKCQPHSMGGCENEVDLETTTRQSSTEPVEEEYEENFHIVQTQYKNSAISCSSCIRTLVASIFLHFFLCQILRWHNVR